MDFVKELLEYVRHASVSTDPAFASGMNGAREKACDLLRRAGLEVEVVPTPLHPIILGRRKGPAEWPHVVLYGHYDVQPAEPLDLWTTPAFEPVVRDGRIWGRGTADNKGPHLVAIVALARLLARHPNLPLRITFLIEGEEEIGIEDEEEIDLAELLREIEEIDEIEESEAIDEAKMKKEKEDKKEDEDKKKLKKELDEAYSAIETLKDELNEINLLNAKLLYTNKIFKAKNLNESQKVKVLSSFDKAKNVGEVKMVFETLNEGIKVSKNIIKENLGSASKTTMTPNVKKPIVESNDAFLRMQKLAGII